MNKKIYTENSVRLFNETLGSLIERIKPSGYAPTSVTGAYPGMFMRDSANEIMALIKCGEYENARKMLDYIFKFHIEGNHTYVLHVISDDGHTVISTRPQTDATFFIIHAWCMYVNESPESEGKTELIKYTVEKVGEFAEYWFSVNNTYDEKMMLLRNPCFEHSRDTSYFNSFDLLTNVTASQALYEFAPLYKEYGSDKEYPSTLSKRAEAIRQGINANLTATVEGKKVYAEMQSVSKETTPVTQFVDDDRFIIGFSWVNFIPVAVGWYGMDAEIMENTYNAYVKNSSRVYYEKYNMLEATTTYSPERTLLDSSQVIGKGYAWELMYCQMTNRTDRIKELVEFYDQLKTTYYFETWNYAGYGSDAANQEHASWQVYAFQQVFGFAD